MPSTFDIDYPSLQRHVAPLSITAAELHGSLCGFLCAGGQPTPGQWLDQLRIDPAGLDGGSRDDLEKLRRSTIHQLDDPELGFALMLPDDDSGMAQRVNALSQWCGGFLGGYGLGAPAVAGRLSDDGKDALRDLGRIAQFGYEAGEEEEDENAFAEILEYVRVAVVLLRQEGLPGETATSATRH
ncbi:UPF0149 family protein [Pseudofulvimonas gallinarii]|uniref:Uncharacterized protein n=1 Tax=Pseudofulvimonas gallinarii TaxID=634155 RepID=A0A4R3LK65_9GAMM|nr:UPF0149 family protein [Pseudofulvimonas gallinarii]TCT00241.1 hypothetical protein EDC25_1038 [Pseudofulvimonas gallinarii]